MQNRRIEIAVVNHTPKFIETDRLEFMGAKTRLERFALWFAKKTGILATQPFAKLNGYETAVVELDDIQGAILSQEANIEHLTNRTAKYVLIGHDFIPKMYDYQNLGMREFNFYRNVQSHPRNAYYGGGSEVVNEKFRLELVFVPFMKGCLVLPDLELLKR